MMITQPDYLRRACLYLHNLASGIDFSDGAIRSLGEDPVKFNAEVDRYFNTRIASTQAPNRALNTERDFRTTILTSDEDSGAPIC